MDPDGAAYLPDHPENVEGFSVERAELHVHSWNSQCGECGYGGTSWADSPAREGLPILDPDSKRCPNCGLTFTHVRTLPGYPGEHVKELPR